MSNRITWSVTIIGGMIGCVAGYLLSKWILNTFELVYGFIITTFVIIILICVGHYIIIPLVKEPIKEEHEWTKQK